MSFQCFKTRNRTFKRVLSCQDDHLSEGQLWESAGGSADMNSNFVSVSELYWHSYAFPASTPNILPNASQLPPTYTIQYYSLDFPLLLHYD